MKLVKTVKVFTVIFAITVLLLPKQADAIGNQVDTEQSHEVGAFTIFDPNFRYLDDGTGNLSNLGNGKVSVWGQTLGTRKVDTIGVQVTLQRWTGSEWIDVNTGDKITYSNASYAFSSREISVLTGYYYRVKSRHWIDYDGVHEEGTVYSDSLLIK